MLWATLNWMFSVAVLCSLSVYLVICYNEKGYYQIDQDGFLQSLSQDSQKVEVRRTLKGEEGFTYC